MREGEVPEGSDLRLRPYRRSDLAAMVALDEVCFAPEFLFGRAAMRRFAEADGAYAVIAERGPAVVGFAIGQMEGGGREGYCVTLDVAPAERGRGLGGVLLGELERWAAERGAGAMRLHVWAENAGARRFYAGRGYREVGVEVAFYGLGMDAVVCWKGFAG